MGHEHRAPGNNISYNIIFSSCAERNERQMKYRKYVAMRECLLRRYRRHHCIASFTTHKPDSKSSLSHERLNTKTHFQSFILFLICS